MTKYVKGDEVWEQRRRSFAKVLSVHGSALSLENDAGAQWIARAEQCTPATDAVDQAAPDGTRPMKALPGDVQVSDYVWVAGAYREVIDMRGSSHIGGKILVLKGHGLWVMPYTGTVYRPVHVRTTR
ncbi:hypothetical protein [Streptomyces sp. BA2]|uniref:hypothetical protein n=1 Tax=Streptomyces sp. BA2 TaxID=436595 RepID=UPI00132991B2|nr:hypothetical protein [Streptomyces sp. BA2]MWA12072.1 hypothetical protein [Streptomyces sp. BA2]